MNTEVHTIADLEDYIASPRYMEAETVPVSPERFRSYIRNPRCRPDMPVLFTLSEGNRLLAYRTLLPDYFLSHGQKVPFAWLSGNYVVPDRRREGLSSRLLKVVEGAWEGRLMYTNYAPASKAVYDRSGAFSCFGTRPGRRYYMRSSLFDLMRDRLNAGSLLKFTDRLVNSVHDPLIRHLSFDDIPGVSIRTCSDAGSLPEGVISRASERSLFGRGAREYDWILKFPWVTTQTGTPPAGKYHFTRIVSAFSNKLFHMESDEGEAFLWITVTGDRMKVPYFFHSSKTMVAAARQIVLREMVAGRCAHLTIRHPELGPALATRRNPFIHSRPMPQHYFAHRSLTGKLPGDLMIHDGDGDCVFT